MKQTNRFRKSSGYLLLLFLLLLAISVLATCGGGGGGGGSTSGGGGGGGTTPPAAPSPTLSYGIKQLQFSWPAVSGATFYRLFENADGVSAFAQVGSDISTTSVSHSISLYRRVNAKYKIASCNSAGCTDSAPLALAANLVPAIGYFKASNTEAFDYFGYQAVALSADGSTLAVGAYQEDSSATGINGSQSDNSASNSGAVYVFTRDSSGLWSQQAYVKASNTDAGDQFGISVSLSADGNTLAVGAMYESSSSTGINGIQNNNNAPSAGAVYVFTRSGNTWTQQAYIKASHINPIPYTWYEFGEALALSADGNTLAVGALGEHSNATGINGDQTDTSAGTSGAVYVFTRSGSTWSQQAYVKASNTGILDQFGIALALSGDGNTLAVGAVGERSSATGINGNQVDDSADYAGAVYVFLRTSGTWTQQAYIKSSNTGTSDYFGCALALSTDGNTLAVGANYEDSSATGINGNQNDDSAVDAGAVYVFTRSAGVWSQQAYVKASNTDSNDQFGIAVGLSGDGNTLAVGAYGEDSIATGIGGNQTNDPSKGGLGAVYIFTRTSSVWSQAAYVKASNSGSGDSFGYGLALSADGNTLAVGAFVEQSNATGIGGDQTDNSAQTSGAVYIY